MYNIFLFLISSIIFIFNNSCDNSSKEFSKSKSAQEGRAADASGASGGASGGAAGGAAGAAGAGAAAAGGIAASTVAIAAAIVAAVVVAATNDKPAAVATDENSLTVDVVGAEHFRGDEIQYKLTLGREELTDIIVRYSITGVVADTHYEGPNNGSITFNQGETEQIFKIKTIKKIIDKDSSLTITFSADEIDTVSTSTIIKDFYSFSEFITTDDELKWICGVSDILNLDNPAVVCHDPTDGTESKCDCTRVSVNLKIKHWYKLTRPPETVTAQTTDWRGEDVELHWLSTKTAQAIGLVNDPSGIVSFVTREEDVITANKNQQGFGVFSIVNLDTLNEPAGTLATLGVGVAGIAGGYDTAILYIKPEAATLPSNLIFNTGITQIQKNNFIKSIMPSADLADTNIDNHITANINNFTATAELIAEPGFSVTDPTNGRVSFVQDTKDRRIPKITITNDAGLTFNKGDILVLGQADTTHFFGLQFGQIFLYKYR